MKESVVRQISAYDVIRDERLYRLDIVGIVPSGELEQIHVDYRKGQKTKALELMRKMVRKAKLKPLSGILDRAETPFKTMYLPLR